MDERLEALQETLGYTFRNPVLLERAVTHASAGTDENPPNERLEFLGDAVIGMVVSAYLFRTMPGASEGDMTVIKSGVVSRKSLGVIGREIGIGPCLRVDDGLKSRGTYPNSMVGGAYEAIVGAIYVDGGYDPARTFVLDTLEDRIDEVGDQRHLLSSKSVLQQKSQAEVLGVPRYEIVKTEGPDHERRFLAAVWVGDEKCGEGWGVSKKGAERAAARQALDTRYPGWDRVKPALERGD
jgi:ribonuclease-3